jgi:hypothetical protein
MAEFAVSVRTGWRSGARRGWLVLLVVGLCVVLLAPVVVVVAPGSAVGANVPAQQPLSITYVARECASYSDIMANKRRNNLMESLRDLGPDSNYAAAEAVSAAKEQSGSPACVPLQDWRFSTGTAYTGPSDATLNLSVLTNVLRSDVLTQASAPELDGQGEPTGRTIAGAVTVPLSDAEASAAARSTLRVQGGTPSQPLNGLEEEYGYGALRCAADAVNGDNIEYLSFPPGTRHVFCYYYAVTPPPTAGTITVHKEVSDTSSGQGAFRFDGNVSYADSNADGTNDFTLTASSGAPAQASFVRGAGGEPWTFAEQPVDGWSPAGPPLCTVANPEGEPTSEIAITGSQVSVDLGPLDQVTCTFTNQRSVDGAVLRKETLGGVGTFDFELVGTDPPAPPVLSQVTTTEPGVAVEVISLDEIAPGDYYVAETLPAPTALGSWEVGAASCAGQDIPVTVDGPLRRTAELTLPLDPQDPTAPLDCVVTNVFTPAGSITVTKTTLGATGVFPFVVTPNARTDVSWAGSATTTVPGVSVGAAASSGVQGPLAAALPVDPAQPYTVTELLPAPSDAGRWVVESVDCGPNGAGTLDPTTASITVVLTQDNPAAECAFVNRFVPTGTLDVIKTTTADTTLRPDPAQLVLVCEDGTRLPFQVAPAESSSSLDQVLVTATRTCTLEEPSTGAADGVSVDTQALLTIDGGEAVPLDLGEEFEIAEARAVNITVSNELQTAPPPTTPPTEPSTSPPATAPPTPTPPGDQASPPGGSLAHTGSSVPRVLGMAALLVLAGGAVTLVVRRRASHDIEHP